MKVPLNENAWEEDERIRKHGIFMEEKRTREWFERKIRNCLIQDEASIPDHIDRSPKPDDTDKLPFKITRSSERGLIGGWFHGMAP